MAESSLSMSYSDLQAEVGFMLGYGYTVASYSTDQLAAVNRLVSHGLRNFYFPSGTSHKWTFLQPAATISLEAVSGAVDGTPSYSSGTGLSSLSVSSGMLQTRMAGWQMTFGTSGNSYDISSVSSTSALALVGDASGEASNDSYSITIMQDYDLPDDFGRIIGNLSFSGADWFGKSVKIVSEFKLREMRQASMTGRPEAAALRQKSFDGSSGQRWEILLYPRPEQSYTLNYRYEVLANALSSSFPYPYGGAAHAETILAACLAQAELYVNRESGVYTAKFAERLAASLEYDKGLSPDFYGYNGDPSTDMKVRPPRTSYTSYNNQIYGVD